MPPTSKELRTLAKHLGPVDADIVLDAAVELERLRKLERPARDWIDRQLRFQPQEVGFGDRSFQNIVNQRSEFPGSHDAASPVPNRRCMQASKADRSRCSVTFSPPGLLPIISAYSASVPRLEYRCKSNCRSCTLSFPRHSRSASCRN